MSGSGKVSRGLQERHSAASDRREFLMLAENRGIVCWSLSGSLPSKNCAAETRNLPFKFSTAANDHLHSIWSADRIREQCSITATKAATDGRLITSEQIARGFSHAAHSEPAR